MTKEKELHDLLLSQFSYEELRYLVRLLPGGERIAMELSLEGPPAIVAYELVDNLNRRGAIDSNFFEVLLSLRPNQVERIRALWAKWEPQPEEWSKPPIFDESTRQGKAVLAQEKKKTASHVFVSYSRRDATFFEELKSHLTLLIRQNIIDVWDEGRILAGDLWAERIEKAIFESNIFVLLISPDFLASEFSSRIELEFIFKRMELGAKVIPVLVRHTRIPEEHRFWALQLLPQNNIPISEQEDTDEAWLEVSDAIRSASEQMRRLWTTTPGFSYLTPTKISGSYSRLRSN